MFIPIWVILCFFLIVIYMMHQRGKEIDRLNNTIFNKKSELSKQERRLSEKAANLESYVNIKINSLVAERAEIVNERKKWEQEKGLIINLENSSISKFPFIAGVLADYRTARDSSLAWQLEHKKRPALKAAEVIQKVKREKREILQEAYAYKWELSYLKSLLPWLDELSNDIIISSDQSYNQVDSKVDDEAIRWLSPEEYNKLPDVEKYQRALDRYMKRPKKSSWEAGQEYERYIGYLYESDGFHVTYFGASEGLHDLGRDLICKKEGSIHIVQCKRWSTKKQIHEKHINQLFGTTVMYYLSEISKTHTADGFYQALNDKKIVPVFASTTGYSETALKFAKSLGVICKTKPMGPYPVIKCNINQSTREHIYHLPFDQQYDHCIISKEQGEFYALTVQEAEDAGFRRAKRWHGPSSHTKK